MDGSAMLQISNHGDRKIIHSSKFVSDCKNVEQRLRRMFTSSITGIQYRFSTMLCYSL